MTRFVIEHDPRHASYEQVDMYLREARNMRARAIRAGIVRLGSSIRDMALRAVGRKPQALGACEA